MTLTIQLVMFIIIYHWFTDFVLQTNEDAQAKSKDNRALLNHTIGYSVMWIIPMASLLGLTNAVAFAAITFVLHTATDYITSRWNSALWYNKEVKRFFESVGYDQVLHYGQLFLTYQLLSQYGI